jgi:hypothetical protein
MAKKWWPALENAIKLAMSNTSTLVANTQKRETPFIA